jgi:DNA modification methylase
MTKRRKGYTTHPELAKTRHMGEDSQDENIGNLPHGQVDAVITSPPYAHESTAAKPTKLEKLGLFKMGHSKEAPYTEESYREWSKHREGNIGKRRLFVRVPCPPEEAEFHDTRPGRKGTVWEWTKEVKATPEVIEKIQKLKSEKRGRSETYLEAMFRVYSECFKVLKPGGKMVLVVKCFIRNKKVVRLDLDTKRLCEAVGFRWVETKLFKLPFRSFWRILQFKKYGDQIKDKHLLDYEFVMCFEKPVGGDGYG